MPSSENETRLTPFIKPNQGFADNDQYETLVVGYLRPILLVARIIQGFFERHFSS
jgi:hypothetical protein